MQVGRSAGRWLWAGWGTLAAVLAASALALVWIGGRFQSDLSPVAMPILQFALAYASLGAAFLSAVPLVRASIRLTASNARTLLAAILGLGLALRLVLFASEPILEVDFNRYLWDGAMAIWGHNPYTLAPAEIASLPYNDPRLLLSQAAPMFDRISYPELKTIYPPVAIAAFALAALIEPFSLSAWRCVGLAMEIATLCLLLDLLRAAGRSQLWVALYWLNPLVLKELANSAHMEVVVVPLVLAALSLAVRGHNLTAVLVLALAAGAKLWPALLLGLVLRPLWGSPVRLILAAALFAGSLAAMALPVLLGGIGPSSGFVAYAREWATASAHFLALETIISALAVPSMITGASPGQLARWLCASLAILIAARLSWAPIAGVSDMLRRAYLVTSVIVLLSPAQFPWYLLWVLPLAVIQPRSGWHIATATLPLYYTAFYFRLAGHPAVFDDVVVFAIWLPVWLALAVEHWRQQRPEMS